MDEPFANIFPKILLSTCGDFKSLIKIVDDDLKSSDSKYRIYMELNINGIINIDINLKFLKIFTKLLLYTCVISNINY